MCRLVMGGGVCQWCMFMSGTDGVETNAAFVDVGKGDLFGTSLGLFVWFFWGSF